MEPHQRCTEIYLTHRSVTRADFKKTAATCWDMRTWRHCNPVKHGGTLLQVFRSVSTRAQSMENICVCVCVHELHVYEVAALQQQTRAEAAYLSWGSLGNMTTIETVPQLLNYSFTTGTNHISGKSVCPSGLNSEWVTVQHRWLIKRKKKERNTTKIFGHIIKPMN